MDDFKEKKIQSGFPTLSCFTRSGVRTICDLVEASVVSNIEPLDVRSFPLGKVCVRARSILRNVIFLILVLDRYSNSMLECVRRAFSNLHFHGFWSFLGPKWGKISQSYFFPIFEESVKRPVSNLTHCNFA